MDMTAADIAAVTRPNMYGYGGGYGDGFGFGGGSGLWFLALLFLVGANGFGGRTNVATTEDLASGFNFSGVNNKLNEITAGIASVNQNLGNAICTSTYELASKIDNGNYQTILAIKELGSSLKDDKISNLQQQLTALQIQQATCGIPKSSPYGFGIYAYPTCATGCGYNTNI